MAFDDIHFADDSDQSDVCLLAKTGGRGMVQGIQHRTELCKTSKLSNNSQDSAW